MQVFHRTALSIGGRPYHRGHCGAFVLDSVEHYRRRYYGPANAALTPSSLLLNFPMPEIASVPPAPRRRHLLRWIVVCLAAAMVLAGAVGALFINRFNLFGLAYNHLDLIVNYELRSFVELTPGQRKDFDWRFQQLWTWHRRTKLWKYDRLLDQALIPDGRKLSAEHVREMLDNYEIEKRELLEHVIAYGAPLLGTLDDRQIHSLLTEIDRRAEKARSRVAKLDDEGLKEQRYKKAVHQLKEWSKAATPAQLKRLRLWVDQTQPLEKAEAAYWDEQRRALPAVLAQRHEADFPSRLRRWAYGEDRPDYSEQHQREAAQREALIGLVADLAEVGALRQIWALNGRLGGYAKVCKQLSNQGREGGPH